MTTRTVTGPPPFRGTLEESAHALADWLFEEREQRRQLESPGVADPSCEPTSTEDVSVLGTLPVRHRAAAPDSAGGAAASEASGGAP